MTQFSLQYAPPYQVNFAHQIQQAVIQKVAPAIVYQYEGVYNVE
jgi:hypothetical protein